MIYQKFLDKIKKNNSCPFCNFEKDLIISQNKFAIMTVARAPYTKDHLLVIPKRHTQRLHSLKRKEKEKIMELITKGIDILHKKYKGIEIFYKEGDSLEDAGKSIYHLHFHLVPKKKILEQGDDKRNFYSQKKARSEVKKIKELFKK